MVCPPCSMSTTLVSAITAIATAAIITMMFVTTLVGFWKSHKNKVTKIRPLTEKSKSVEPKYSPARTSPQENRKAISKSETELRNMKQSTSSKSVPARDLSAAGERKFLTGGYRQVHEHKHGDTDRVDPEAELSWGKRAKRYLYKGQGSGNLK